MRLCILKHSMGEDVVKMRRNAFANVSHLPVHAVRTIRSANWQEYVRSIQNCLISLSLSLSLHYIVVSLGRWYGMESAGVFIMVATSRFWYGWE